MGNNEKVRSNGVYWSQKHNNWRLAFCIRSPRKGILTVQDKQGKKLLDVHEKDFLTLKQWVEEDAGLDELNAKGRTKKKGPKGGQLNLF